MDKTKTFTACFVNVCITLYREQDTLTNNVKQTLMNILIVLAPEINEEGIKGFLGGLFITCPAPDGSYEGALLDYCLNIYKTIGGEGSNE